MDGDGCSAGCKIETGYVCRGGTNETKSMCSYSGPLQFSLNTTIKDPKANSITMKFAVHPALTSLEGLNNLRSLISTNFPNKGISVSYQNGELVVSVNYTESIQGKAFTVSFASPGNGSSLFALQGSSVEVVVNPDNNEAAVYYPD